MGDFQGNLKNSGEDIRLSDAFGAMQCVVPTWSGVLVDLTFRFRFVMEYSDAAPWSPLADGFGSSLELACYEAVDMSDPHAWRASPPPVHSDSHVEFGGSPGQPSTYLGCPGESQATALASLVFTEIMYNPVGKKSYEELHEFIEIHNTGNSTVDLSSFRVLSAKSLGVSFAFPDRASIAPSETILLVKDVDEFAAVYGNVTAQVFGPYEGELSNGGDELALLDLNNRVVDFISYDDEAPWPIAAGDISRPY